MSRTISRTADASCAGGPDRPHDEVHVRVHPPKELVRILRVGNVHLGLRVGVRLLAHVADDADDFHVGELRIGIRRRAELDALAQRVLAAEVLARHGLVDDDDARRTLTIALVEQTPAHERNAQRLEVAAADGAVAGHRVLVRRRGGRPLTLKWIVEPAPLIGSIVVTAAERTPGSAASRSSSAITVLVRVSSLAYRSADIGRSAASA